MKSKKTLHALSNLLSVDSLDFVNWISRKNLGLDGQFSSENKWISGVVSGIKMIKKTITYTGLRTRDMCARNAVVIPIGPKKVSTHILHRGSNFRLVAPELFCPTHWAIKNIKKTYLIQGFEPASCGLKIYLPISLSHGDNI